MSDNKKYYYLKLKEDFFNSEEMMILESMKNGAEYQNVYLKLCLLSLKSDGALIFKNMLPYSVEMLSSVLRINIDTVKTAIELFQKLGLISITDTETIYMTDIQTLVGQSSTEAERVKKYRQTLAQKKSEAKLIESAPAEEIIEEEQCKDEVVQETKEEISESCTESVQMYKECTEMLQNCTPENRDKRLELRDKSLNLNNNSEEIAVINGKAEKKKSKRVSKTKPLSKSQQAQEFLNTLSEKEQEDYKECARVFYNFKKSIRDTFETSEATLICWQSNFAKCAEEFNVSSSEILNTLIFAISSDYWKQYMFSPDNFRKSFEKLYQQKTCSNQKSNNSSYQKTTYHVDLSDRYDMSDMADSGF